MGFLDSVKQNTQRAAWEAERMVRVNKANGAVSDARREIDAQIMNLGRAVLQSYDGGAQPPAEAAPVYDQVKTAQSKLALAEQEVERIKAEQAPQPPPAAAPAAYTPPPPAPGYTPPGPPPGATGPAGYAPPPPAPGGYAPPGPAAYAPPPAPGSYAPTGPAPGGYAPTGPDPGGYAPTGPAPSAYAAPMSSSVASAMAPGQEDPDSDTGTVVCPNCGAERTNPAAMFCQECGTRYNS